MSYIELTTFTFYTLFSLLIVCDAIAVEPLFYKCSSFENFTSNNVYKKNLNKLIGNLYRKTPPSGFGLNSVGHHQAKAFGLSLCRGDVSSTNCTTCITNAGSELRTRCPNNKNAIIWYDNCLLKYSNTNFFGKIDESNKFYLLNIRNVSNYQDFNERTEELLSGLVDKAYKTPKLYASGEMNLSTGPWKKLYGMVQCTRDVSRVDCKKCLDNAISELPYCCDGKEGGRVVGGTCNVRYEIYPFVSV